MRASLFAGDGDLQLTRCETRAVSMRPLLRDMVSSNEEQVFRCPSQHPARSFAPPFALAFSKGALATDGPLAIATDIIILQLPRLEEGRR